MIINENEFHLDKPSLIAFEGGNGVGKSTLIKAVSDHLKSGGNKVITTREPGGTKLGMKIRSLVKEEMDLSIDPVAELCLFAADRAQHVNTLILPALNDKQYVLTDRFFYSTYAFQGAGRKLTPKIVEASISMAVADLKPALVVLIDLSVEEAIKRQAIRQSLGQTGASAEQDRFEHEDLEFQNAIRESFLQMAKTTTEPWLVLDGMLSANVLAEKVIRILR